jgi:glycogen synthase
MKVLMFGWEFPPHISGGLGTACYGLVKGLLNKGVHVLFVVPKTYGDEDGDVARIIGASDVVVDVRDSRYTEFWSHFSYMEINSRLVPYVSLEEYYQLLEKNTITGKESLESVYTRKFHFTGAYGPSLLEEVEKYALVAGFIAGQNDHDIIHAHDWLTYKAGIAARKASGKPLVVHMHATEFDRSGENVNQLVYDIERAGLEAADLIIAVSDLTRNTVIKRYGIKPNKVVTVHNGVSPLDHDLSGIEKSVREKIVTFLGRITYQKGPDYFVEAARKVLNKDPNVRFVMAGSGDMLNKMIRRTAALKMGSRFHFTGFLKGLEVNKMFALSDVYVMPSVSEPFGISPLEAMRSNVPVVISKQSGVAEVLNFALKVDFWDIDGLADAIYGLLNYPALSGMFRKYGKEEVENIKWDHAAEKVKDVYLNLVHQKK